MKKYILLLSCSLGIVLISIQSVGFSRTTSNAESTSKQVLLRLAQLKAPTSVKAFLPALQAGFSISGRIADGSGQSLSGVTVTLSGSESSSTTTDANGNYSFGSLAGGGNYIVTPSSGSYSFSPPDQTFNHLDVNRIAHFVGSQTLVSIMGTVSNAGNVGIGDVTVQLFKNGALSGSAVTDNTGKYGFGGLTSIKVVQSGLNVQRKVDPDLVTQ